MTSQSKMPKCSLLQLMTHPREGAVVWHRDRADPRGYEQFDTAVAALLAYGLTRSPSESQKQAKDQSLLWRLLRSCLSLRQTGSKGSMIIS